jgi:hypothetical protein
VKQRIPRLIQKIERENDLSSFTKVLDKVVSLSDYYDDDDVINALCYVIAVTDDDNVRFQALTIIDKIKGR